MSSLLHLKLDGIRSYCFVGQIDENSRRVAQQSQSINFKKPLTLIWGHNGSGKTTIIEALRTITTGIQPPNSDKGRSFLTDSHLLGQTKTEGCIELAFQSINEREIVARKHFNLVHDGPSSCKFSSQRSTIQTRSNETGKLETLHSTCANFEKSMPCFLGVAVPILTNVLLCHQEEQLWMFSDNSTLKGIFDELFETTDLVNIEQKLKDQLKEAESHLKILSNLSDSSKRDLEDGFRQKNNMEQQLQKFVQETQLIQNIKKQLEDIQFTPINFDIIQNKMNERADLIAIKNNLLENKNNLNLDEINLNLIEEYETINSNLKQIEIQHQNTKFQSQQVEISLEKKKSELQELQIDTSIDQIKQEIKVIRDQIKNFFVFQSNIQDENLIKLLNEKCQQYKKETQDQQEFQQNIIQNLQTKIDQQKQQKQEIQLEIKLQQAKYEEQKQNKDTLQLKIKTKEQQLYNLQIKYNETIQKEEQQSQIYIIKNELEIINQNLLECLDINQKNDQIKRYQQLLIQIKDQDIIQQDNSQKLEIIIRKNGWNSILKLNASNLDRDLSIVKLNESLKQKIQSIKITNANLQAQLKILNEQKNEIKKELLQCNSTQTDTNELEIIKEKLREVKQNKIKYIFNQSEFIDQYINSCKQSGKCLLCLKPTDQQCLDQLKQRIQSNIPKTKAKINEFDLRIAQLQNEKSKILNGLKNNELTQKIKDIDFQINNLQLTLTNSQNNNQLQEIENQLSDLDEIKNILQQKQFNQKEQLLQQKTSLEQQYTYLKFNQNIQSNIYNLQQLQKTKQELQIKLNQYDKNQQCQYNSKLLNEQIIELQSDIMKLKQQFSTLILIKDDNLKTKLNEIETLLIQFELDLQNKNELFVQQIISNKQQINNFETIIPQLEQKICKKQELLNKTKNNQKYQIYVVKLQNEIQNDIKLLEELQLQLVEQEYQIEQFTELLNKIIQLKKWQEFDNQEIKINDQIQVLDKILNDIQFQYEQQQILKAQQDKLQTEFDLRKQKLDQSFNDHKKTSQDINKRYDGSESKRLQIISEQIAMYQLIRDLKQYLEILESTMLECHAQKMKEINKYLFDTWQKIYNGKDIKFIEVKFDEIPNQKKMSKKYNYRLVMRTSNNTEIDMKGRCSMGQKMLASIVFRMALAECFGSNCCFLALDEPTSNLDRKHIKTLADQLNNLIEFMNQHGQQIQLIIITHDMDLVKLLRKHSDTYFKISKKENGFSQIEERQLDELK